MSRSISTSEKSAPPSDDERVRRSEERFRDIAELAGDWIWETDAEHRFTLITGDSTRPTGVRPDDVIGKTRWELLGVVPEQDENWRLHLADLAARRTFRGFRYSMRTPSGREIFIAVSGKPMFDAEGRFRGYRGTASDETAIVVARRRADRLDALLRDAVDSISEGFVVFDEEDRLALCNEAFLRLYPEYADVMVPGARFEDILRSGIAKGIYPQAIGREEEWLAERMRRHREASGTVEQHLADGRTILATERRMKSGGTTGLRIDITAQRKAEAARRENEEMLQGISDNLPAIIFRRVRKSDGTTFYPYISKNFERITGISLEELRRNPLAGVDTLHPEDRPLYAEAQRKALETMTPLEIEYRIVKPDGEVRWIRTQARAKRLADAVQWDGVALDITALHATQDQLHHAEKIQSLGNLTGGVAHDFNNLLAIVIGNLDLLAERIEGNDELAPLAGSALQAAMRGAELTQRLLAFARKQPLRPAVIDFNGRLPDIANLLRRTLGEMIALNIAPAEGLWKALADPVQLETAIVNLAVNARDAMKDGGALTIETANVRLDEAYAAQNAEVAPGDYVMVAVTDTGSGMTPAVIQRAFEPFFTTKPAGQGTGLGLSMVFGFVKQTGGHVKIYSELGHGTTVKLYLPRTAVADDPALESADAAVRPALGSERILLVEDNDGVRATAARILGELGYRVREAPTGVAALKLLEAGEPVDLLFTDIVMPGGLTGYELAAEARRLRPDLRVLLTSGYSEASVRNGAEATGNGAGTHPAVLSKPYRKAELARRVRQVLDAS